MSATRTWLASSISVIFVEFALTVFLCYCLLDVPLIKAPIVVFVYNILNFIAGVPVTCLLLTMSGQTY